MLLAAWMTGGAELSAAPKNADDKPAAERKTSSKKPAAQQRTANKPVSDSVRNPRMPAHFNKLVTPEQRERVLAIVQQYGSQIDQKRAELKALTDERDEALRDVLTPEQRRQLDEYRAQSSVKRAQSVAASSDSDDIASPKASKRAKPGE